jgi:hypothetical protein
MGVDAGPVSYHTVSRSEYASAGIQCMTLERCRHVDFGERAWHCKEENGIMRRRHGTCSIASRIPEIGRDL